MARTIRTAAVIGSGIMGSGIAAHLANAGIKCLLLDIIPGKLTEKEQAAGLTLNDSRVRNRLAAAAMEKMKTTQPSPLYLDSFIERITPGNLEDHLDRLKDVDWIIEVVVENLQVKQQLLQKIESVWTPGTIVSTNTSGISVNAMAEQCGAEFKKHFLGTHFFNPPRYMQLLEIIPGRTTDPEIVSYMSDFCRKRLGKGVVLAKDTPNFIGNRIGIYGLLVTLQEMREKGCSVEEVDAVTGPAMGRPKSATFRTLDLVGIDTFVHVARNVHDHVDQAGEKAVFQVPETILEMVSRGWIGDKSGQGFYKKVKGADGNSILSLDLNTMEYSPQTKVSSASLEAAKLTKGAAEKTKALIYGGDRYSELAWSILKKVLVYSADKLGEIADSIADIDNAMKWGFNWELGPFETWDAIGLVKSVQRMEAEGLAVPQWVKDWIAAGNTSFYKRELGRTVHYLKGRYHGAEENPEVISLRDLKDRGRVVKSNSGGNLIDLGDEVVCLEFQSPNNAIGADILSMIRQSMDEVDKNYKGLVIANEGRNFSVGANLVFLLMEAQDEEWDEIEAMIHQFQQTLLKLKHFTKPVVVAPHRMTLGGGVEVCLAADQVHVSAETYMGLVEVGVGVIPGGGGCKEMALRMSRKIADPQIDLQPFMNQIFETIGMAKVSSSGHDAFRLGYLRETDKVAINRDHLIHEAKQAVLRMDNEGYVPPVNEKFRVVGEDGKAVMQLGAYSLRQSKFISDYDLHVANKLAHVLAGGDVPAGTLVTEQYMLDLEKEAFLSLCGEPKTQQRMQHMLTKGKPLRN
ncbi:3-hydroxyacyl-CoA dehydrogenase/enoyl-CoA hydratase family protein [Ferviditalea candida]|uniref:3-hydroxyacyl-CoA dehydrogenase NAD-binding domain-containing protein n=1 Tax=Ferviditalea candida TaxID=3108399 RepID=A0ABU5ZGJ8_9BACL|nr:3-hydroxyacyl-CoA dehydrogenase NAD-binding domain-containing protein [Paenibacillaceae bacterium T2]